MSSRSRQMPRGIIVSAGNSVAPIQKSPEESTPKVVKATDSPYHVCGGADDPHNMCGGKNLFPIMDPRFNLREAAKQMVLLEDHMFNEGKTCKDCCMKHTLLIEGFLEEAVSLDTENKFFEIIDSSLKEFRIFEKALIDKLNVGPLSREDCFALAQMLRKTRKPLCQQFATFIQ